MFAVPPLLSRRSPYAAASLTAFLFLAGCANLLDRPFATQPPVATTPPVTAPGPLEPPRPVQPGDGAPSETPPPIAVETAPPVAVKPPELLAIGVLLPLSGPSADIGRALFDAAQMALFDQAGDRIRLLPRDTTGTPDGARRAAESALGDGAKLIIGPVFAQSVAAVAPIARERGVNVLTFSTDRSVAGNGVYLLGFTPEEQIARVVAHARSRGLWRFAALAPDTPYGQAVVAALRQAVARHGGEIVRVENYPPDTTELAAIVRQFAHYEARQANLMAQKRELEAQGDDVSREALKRLRNIETLGDADFDALLLPEGGPRLRALAPLLPYYDIDPKAVRFLGTGLWDEPGLGNEPAMVGAWFATTPPQESNAFRKRFEAAFGRRPPRIASLAYDAIALAAALAQRHPAEPFAAQALANPNGFSGYDGIFRFGPDNVIERGLAVIEIQPRGFRVVNPAPTTFEAPIN